MTESRSHQDIQLFDQDSPQAAELLRELHDEVLFPSFPANEYISPTTKPSTQDKQPVYEGRVALERNYYQVAGSRYALRYGMTASAEIVVRERRLIDLGLDPFRQLAG